MKAFAIGLGSTVVILAIAWLIWYRLDSRSFEFVGVDTSGQYEIYVEVKPCVLPGCLYVFRRKGSKDIYNARVGKVPCLVNFQPKSQNSEAIVFRKDQCVGKTLTYVREDDFFNRPMTSEGGMMAVPLGDNNRHDMVRFSAPFVKSSPN